MVSNSFNEQAFEQKLAGLKDTQDSINSLSQWCFQHKEHHKKIVACWLHCLKRVKVEVRLSLFYLANDVIQHSKRKHYEFNNSWATALQKATPLVRDDKVRHKIQRIFKIWEERGVYEESFIADLLGLLTSSVKKKTEVEAILHDGSDFDPVLFVRKIKEIKVLGDNTDVKYKRIKDNKLPLTDAESMRHSLKDRRHGSDVVAEVDNGVKKMEAYVKALESEIGSREKLVELLRCATTFYEDQREEVKKLSKVYKYFANRLKSRQKALNDLITNLPSPVPSPDVNAPSPSPDSDLDAKTAAHQQSLQHQPAALANNGDMQFNLMNSSFIGSAEFLGLSREIFSSQSASQQSTEPQAIQVIGTRDAPAGFEAPAGFDAPAGFEASTGFDATEFLKTLITSKQEAVSLLPPPVPPLPVAGSFSGWCESAPWDQPPPDSAKSPPLYEKQVTHPPAFEYDDTIPIPPLPDVDHRILPQELPPDNHQMPLSGDGGHRSVMPMHGMNIMPPNLAAPPPPPAAVKALLDVDHRNLISLTGSPGARSEKQNDAYRKDDTSYPPPHNPYNKEDINFPPPQSYHKVEPAYGQGGFNQTANNSYSEDEYDNQHQEFQQRSNVRELQEEPQGRAPWQREHRDTDPRVKDNVESIDMDCSDDDEESHRQGGENHRQHYAGAQRDEPQQRAAIQPLLAPPPPPPSVFRGGHQQFNSAPGLPLRDRLFALSAGAKLIAPDPPPLAPAQDENNGFDDFTEDFEEYPQGSQERFPAEEYEEEYQEEYYHDAQEMAPVRPPRPRWRSPAAHGAPRGSPRGPRPPRPRFGYQGSPVGPRPPRPRFFRPRGRW